MTGINKIKKCGECNTYTLEDTCPDCGSTAASPEPPKFSVPDRYGEYRRESKKGDK